MIEKGKAEKHQTPANQAAEPQAKHTQSYGGGVELKINSTK